MSNGSTIVPLASFAVSSGRRVEALFGATDEDESDLPSDEVGGLWV